MSPLLIRWSLKLGIANALLIIEVFNNPVFAQIIPDSTLNTNVNQSGTTFAITGGTPVGGNLFHSFEEFSPLSGTEAFFDYNVTDISNIISRVTGNKISNINGIIHANGTANLFLINPNGIVFGLNAALNIGGSFIASTADSIEFADGTSFSAKNTQTPPLLSINVPLGLQYGNNPAAIEVQESTLAVSPDRTLSLLGGNITINGGKLLAPGGQINLGGLAKTGTIAISDIIPSFLLSVQRGNVTISNGAMANVTTNTSAGNITINSNNLNIFSASQLLAGIDSNSGISGTSAGNILVNATGDITLSDRSLIANTVLAGGLGKGGDIDITGNSLTLTSGGRIATVTQSLGAAGNIKINSNNLDIYGFTADGLFSGILSHSQTANSGATGRITINQQTNSQGRVRLANRGFIATATDSSSNGGSIEVNAHNLILESGGQILTSASNSGSAGDITINATGSVKMMGSSNDFITSPFTGVTVFNLDNLPFSTQFNSEVESSNTIPHISLQRTPEQIISGQTVLGTANQGFDYYGFTINQPNSRVIIDIDRGNGYLNIPGSLDTDIVLFNKDTGETVANNDDASLTLGGGGSIVNEDSYISTTLSPGNYVIGVGEFDVIPSSIHLLEGDRIDRGDTYTLQVSLPNHGGGNSISPNPFNPNNFNPNYGNKSGLVSVTQTSGNTGSLTINTGQLLMESGANITATSSGVGRVGDITVNAATVNIDNSSVFNTTRGTGDAGRIIINTDNLNMNHLGLVNISNFGQGNTGDIKVNSINVNLANGAGIENNTYGQGNTGRVIINASETVALDGQVGGGRSRIANIVGGDSAVGNAGGIEVNTRSFLVTNSATVISNTYGQGNGGDITINASDRVILDGRANNGRTSSLLNRVRARGRGNAGDINVNTRLFSMSNGAELLNQTQGIGDPGNLNINADEIILNNSTISSSVESTAIGNGRQLNFNARTISITNKSKITASTSGIGDAGQIFLEATQSITLNNSEISTGVNNQGKGKGGDIEIQTGSLILDDRSSLTAATASGEGGDIRLHLNDLLLLRHNSQITATAGTTGAGGDGGNIEINAPFIVAITTENSDITANAFEGNGGRISIKTNSIFGLDFRDKLTPLSDITASSELGIAGVVEINTLNVNPSSGLVKLPETLTDTTNQVVVGCAAAQGNSFTITGRGGLPEDPTATIRGQTVWQDLQDFSLANEGENTSVVKNQSPITNSQNPQTSIGDSHEGEKAGIVEATGLVRDEQGNVRLVAPRTNPNPSSHQASVPNCHQLSSFGVPQSQ